jgi:hypothetical protein
MELQVHIACADRLTTRVKISNPINQHNVVGKRRHLCNVTIERAGCTASCGVCYN